MAGTDPGRERFEDLLDDDDPAIEDVLACVFDVRDHEARAYEALLARPDSTIAELAGVLDRDRSNVNRSLETLREKGLATRTRRVLDGGGHVYQYAPTPVADARERMHEALDEWAATVHASIDDFGAGADGD
ncbi:MAG: helix-turn-helix domain-containing protein [Haloarculaceae archaeon]